MFTEILKVKPVLDESAARKMESGLSKRMSSVAAKFGKGLTSAGMKFAKGTFLFAILGLITKLMNPLNDMEDRIKALLGKGADLKDAAAQFNAQPGQLLKVENMANNLGVSKDDFHSMTGAVLKAIEEARLAQMNGKPLEGNAKAVQNFLGSNVEVSNPDGTSQIIKPNDLENVAAFFQSIKSLNAKDRANLETAFFGGIQKGANQKLLESDWVNEIMKQGGPTVRSLNQATNKTATLAEKDRRITNTNEEANFVAGAGKVKGSMVDVMAASKQREAERELAQLDQFTNLQKAKEGIDTLNVGLDKLMGMMTESLGYMGRFAKWAGEGKLEEMLDKQWNKMKSWRPWGK